MLMSFPPATEMVQFAGFASPGYGFTMDTPKGVGCPIRRSEDPRALAPPLSFSQRATSFIASRCQGIHQMPFSSKLAHAQPQARQARAQRTEDRRQRTDQDAGDPASILSSALCDLRLWSQAMSLRSAEACAPAYLHTHAQVQPDGTAGPASRSRLASRCPRSDDREQRTDQTVHRAPPRSRTRGPDDSRPAAEDGAAPSVLCLCLCPLNLVGLGRLERPTSRLSGVRSNQLSYRPVQRPENRDTDDRPPHGCGIICPLASVL